MIKKDIKIKILIIVFIYIFSLSTFPVTSNEISSSVNNGNTLYVGGSGPGNYSRIQDAVDNASNGYTIFVYNGSYTQYVWIDKSINLIGEDKNTTIIEGGWGVVLIINADNVCVTGFTVRDCGSYYIGGIHLRSKSNNVTIIDNILTNNHQCGISIHGDYNKIQNNIIKNNPHGIKLSADNNSIEDNTFDSNNQSGIYFVWIRKNENYPNYYDNTIKNNVFSNNEEGVYVERSERSIISNNLFVNNVVGISSYFDEELSYKNNTVIENNTILYCKIGINLADANNSIIKDNIIALNTRSFWLYDCNKTKIYHNNIASNKKSPIDESWTYDNLINYWDNGYPEGGNFWSDYEGADNYSGPGQNIPGSDGIGDRPYNISGNINSKDKYPLMEPIGLLFPIANFTYSDNGPPIIFNASSSYDPDGKIILYEWYFGDGGTGKGKIISHKYCDIGTYNVTLTVTDETGLKNEITKSIEIILPNSPPLKPDISGPCSGKPDIEYEYDFILLDPDNDELYLWVDWGDGNNTSWIGPYRSGETVRLGHIWNETGIYKIRAKLKDICGNGPWGRLKVNIPKIKIMKRLFLLRLLEMFSNIVNFLESIK